MTLHTENKIHVKNFWPTFDLEVMPFETVLYLNH